MAPAASAATAALPAGHYRFSYPDSWTAVSSPGNDAAFAGASSGGFAPNVVASHGTEPPAKDTAAWLLPYAQDALDAVNASLTITLVQAPRTFTTASGRLAADYIFERDESGTQIRQRQVLFVSDFWKTTYVLTLTDNASTFSSHDADWTLIVDSFGVDGEPEIPDALSITVDGGNSTQVESGTPVVFAVNETLPAGLVIEWFQNGTSVGTNRQVSLTLSDGHSVITVTISNATASRTLTATVAASPPGAPPTPPPTTPPPTGSASGTLLAALVLVALGAAAGFIYYFTFVRPKKGGAEQAAPPTPPPSEPPRP